MNTIVASGFFDPIHVGHIEYLEKAKLLGGKLIVLVNSNAAAIRKKGYYFMDENDRLKIVSSLKFVDEVYIAKDDDGTVWKSLIELKPAYFVKGGDCNLSNLPEKEIEVCKMLNIKIITGLGEKIMSSQELINSTFNNYIEQDYNND